MTVEELIKILQTFSPDLEVKFASIEDVMDEIEIQNVSYKKTISDWLKNHKDSKISIEISFLEETREGPSSIVISMIFRSISDYDRDDVYLQVSEKPIVTKFKAIKCLTDEDLYDILENMYNKGLASIADMKKVKLSALYGILSMNGS